MIPIPLKLRAQIALDPFMAHCIYPGCVGKPEWEHSLLYQNKRVQEAWAIVPCCAFHHRGVGLDKRYNEWVALNRATDAQLLKYAKANWIQKRNHLNTIYGTYTGRT